MSRMENVMMASGLSLDHDDSNTEPKTGITHVNTQSQLSNALSMQVVTGNGCSSFLGTSSGFSIFSPEGLKWVSEKIGGDYFSNLLKIASESHNSVTEIPGPNLWHFRPFEEHHPLPPVELAVKFIDEFFHTLNSTFPLYNQDLFRENYARVPFPMPASDTAWYASLNIVIGIGQIIHMKGLAPDATSLALIRNAASTYVDLVSKHPSLDAVQALLGMTILMQAAEESQAAYFLSASAARIAQSMGLHQKLPASTTKPKQIETRNNVFWICYIIDKGMSLRHGRPSIIHDEDIGVELPDKGSEIFNPSQRLGFYAFYYMSTLALLESRVYSQLYSVRSRTQSKLQRLKTVGNLDHELQTWLETVPVEIRPGQEILCDERDVNVVILVCFAFYNCLIAIHRESAYHGSWTKEGEARMLSKARSQGLNTRVYESAKICLDAARNVIKLLRHYRADAGLPSAGLIRSAKPRTVP
ncbi:fungal-specific transcription factor domain-containing protein [Bisporella sp. PMI_857]|nr:fungal-specific transcription factor domain-containing protein [Bisporella sp. PMI_857]